MDGITILKASEIVYLTYPHLTMLNAVIIGVIFVIMEVIAFCVCKRDMENWNPLGPDKRGRWRWFCYCGFIVFAIGGCFLFQKKEMPTGIYQYECVIDESVNIEDVLEIYDYVDKKDGVWILKDKS